MKILVIAAHPDDEVYGMGGTIAKYVSEGHEVIVLIVTEGCTAQYAGNTEIISKKHKEAEDANAILGVSKVLFADLPDMKLDTLAHKDVNAVIEKVIDDEVPDIVYTHFYGDVNKDHRMVYESTMVAARPINGTSVKEVYCYNVPSSTEWNPATDATVFMPNVFNDISEFTEKKYKSIIKYQTELRQYPHPRSIEAVKAYETYNGLQVGQANTETFLMLRACR